MSEKPFPAPIVPVILSGGSGSRLWPLSTAARPKQLLNLDGDATMIQTTAQRIADRSSYAPAIIVASEGHADAIEAQLAEAKIAGVRLILEPAGRNTAPAVALAAIEAGPEEILLVMPSDHLIRDDAAFTAAVQAALPIAEQGWIVTFGIEPSRPETGFGYISKGDLLVPGVFKADRFIEKPDRDTASRFCEGGWYWNGGIFLLRAGIFLEVLARFAPGVGAAATAAMSGAQRDRGRISPNAQAFEGSPSISIDHAVMEKSEHVAVVPVDMGWSDLGSWDALYDLGPLDANGNKAAGPVLAMDSRDCLLRSDGPRVVALGVKDLIVVATKDSVLIVPRGESQRLKDAVVALRQSGEDI